MKNERKLLNKIAAAFTVLKALDVPDLPTSIMVSNSLRETACAYFYDANGREFYVTVRQTAGPA